MRAITKGEELSRAKEGLPVPPRRRRARSADNAVDLQIEDVTVLLAGSGDSHSVVGDVVGDIEDQEYYVFTVGTISGRTLEQHEQAYKPIDRISRGLTALFLLMLYAGAGLFTIFVEQHIAQQFDNDNPTDTLIKSGMDTTVQMLLAVLLVISDRAVSDFFAKGIGWFFKSCSEGARSVEAVHAAQRQHDVFTQAQLRAKDYRETQALHAVTARRLNQHVSPADGRIIEAVKKKKLLQEGQSKMADMIVVGFADYFSQAVATVLIMYFGDPKTDKVVEWNTKDALLTAAIFGVTMSFLHHVNFSKPFALLYSKLGSCCSRLMHDRAARKIERRKGREAGSGDIELLDMEAGKASRAADVKQAAAEGAYTGYDTDTGDVPVGHPQPPGVQPNPLARPHQRDSERRPAMM